MGRYMLQVTKRGRWLERREYRAPTERRAVHAGLRLARAVHPHDASVSVLRRDGELWELVYVGQVRFPTGPRPNTRIPCSI